MEPRFYRTSDVARMLNVSPKTVSRWAKEGRIPHATTLGGHRRFYRDDVAAIVARNGFHPITKGA